MSTSNSNNDRKEDNKECCICFCEIDISSNNLELSETSDELIGLSQLFFNEVIPSCKSCTTSCCKKDYHISCLNEWLKNKPSCPMCREIIPRNISIFPDYKKEIVHPFESFFGGPRFHLRQSPPMIWPSNGNNSNPDNQYPSNELTASQQSAIFSMMRYYPSYRRSDLNAGQRIGEMEIDAAAYVSQDTALTERMTHIPVYQALDRITRQNPFPSRFFSFF